MDDCGIGGSRKRGRGCDQERKKGVPWTEEEHRRLLMGLQKYGKGEWRNISRNYVISKTPTQVASHAQKYFWCVSGTCWHFFHGVSISGREC